MAIRMSRTFILRKLHQLSGIVPLGAFLLEHFYTNSKAVNPRTGVADFNEAVATLQGIPYILLVEILFIFIPLIFHAVYGLVITWEARPNNLAYPYPRNWFYTIQRLTGMILFFFIAFHVLNMRFGIVPGLETYGHAVAHHPDEAFSIVKGEFSKTWIFAVYVVGITSTIWHFANGIWLFLVDWGIAIGARAQRVTGYACIAVGLALLAVSINALTAFVNPGGLWGGLVY
ncbi:MAG TPA: succinate dehydrogenase cytochrome b558 subunit [Pyrinomonadaceae bacterium]|nr:succinate dehydrogenase cytochrome b558 subunit [Pyrinomonadaceae bacterium]